MPRIIPIIPQPVASFQAESESRNASYQHTLARFDQPAVAENYPPVYGNSFRERRESSCIQLALRSVHAGGEILDLPCGTGRLIPLLAERGFHVTAADASPRMLALAERRELERVRESDSPTGPVVFLIRQVLDTGFEDDRFDGVVSNRLFHHFNEPGTRIAALTELGRICRGSVIVSFFNSFALDAVRFRLKHALRGTMPTDRIPISRQVFEREADAAGLKVMSRNAVIWGLSPLWYLTLTRK